MENFTDILIGIVISCLILVIGIYVGERSYADNIYSELIKQPDITCMEMLQTLESEEE